MRRSSSAVNGPAAAVSVLVCTLMPPRLRAASRNVAAYARRVRERVLVLNAGSSTLKASVLAVGSDDAEAGITVPMRGVGDAADAVRRASEAIVAAGVDLSAVRAVGHRVVHGGSLFTRTTLIDDAVLNGIRELAWLAPLHNPVAAEVIAAARTALPGVP